MLLLTSQLTPAERVADIKNQYVQMCEDINSKVRAELEALERAMITERELN